MTPTVGLVRWRTDGPAPALESSPALGELLAAGYHGPDHARLLGMDPQRIEESVTALASVMALEWSVGDIVARPLTASAGVPAPSVDAISRRMSRFAFLQQIDGVWVLESARSPWRALLLGTSASRVADGDLHDAEWGFLEALGMLDMPQDARVAENWTFHERLFSDRSRRDFSIAPSSWTTGDRPDPGPITDRYPGAPRIMLDVPAMPSPDEPSLAQAVDERRTPQPLSSEPITSEQLGALLFRTLRVRRVENSDPADPRSYLRRYRPVPSGGGMHGTDTWVWTGHVTGIEQAWWWYDPHGHALIRVPGPSQPPADRFTGAAQFWFTAQHPRVSWKYTGISHALELKDVGVIMHAVQLTAATVGLDVRPLGSGSTAAFAACLGIDPEQDCPVGELSVGPRTPDVHPVVP